MKYCHVILLVVLVSMYDIHTQHDTREMLYCHGQHIYWQWKPKGSCFISSGLEYFKWTERSIHSNFGDIMSRNFSFNNQIHHSNSVRCSMVHLEIRLCVPYSKCDDIEHLTTCAGQFINTIQSLSAFIFTKYFDHPRMWIKSVKQHDVAGIMSASQ